jgi:LysM repeat protein
MILKRFLSLALVLMVILVSISIGYTQEENLLENPGFEEGFRELAGFTSAQVANGWQPWIADDSNAPDFQFEPLYIPIAQTNSAGYIPRVRNGNEAQVYYSPYSTHNSGIYQQVSGITSGTELRFSIYAYVFSNNLSELDVSEDDGGVALRVGIDPSGGTDPFSSDVVYSEAAIFYDAYRQYNTIAVAAGDTVTVFVHTTVTEPVANTVIYLDDAVLEVTPESITEEPVVSEEPVVTDEPTKEPIVTDEATEVPITPEEPTPTREVIDAPTEAPVVTDEPQVPTATTAPTQVPTEKPPEEPISDTFPGQIIHTVQRNDTVSQLAARYNSSIDVIIQANNLDNSALIYVGQGLLIPVRIVPTTETPTNTPVVIVVTATPEEPGIIAGTNLYIVQPGDTLSAIARRSNTTLGTLVQLNGITNPNRIFVGQQIRLAVADTVDTLPTATPPPADQNENTGGIIPTEIGNETQPATTYVVQPGDNLFRIALRFGVSLGELGAANNVTNYSLIFVGQTLIIPER